MEVFLTEPVILSRILNILQKTDDTKNGIPYRANTHGIFEAGIVFFAYRKRKKVRPTRENNNRTIRSIVMLSHKLMGMKLF